MDLCLRACLPIFAPPNACINYNLTPPPPSLSALPCQHSLHLVLTPLPQLFQGGGGRTRVLIIIPPRRGAPSAIPFSPHTPPSLPPPSEVSPIACHRETYPSRPYPEVNISSERVRGGACLLGGVRLGYKTPRYRIRPNGQEEGGRRSQQRRRRRRQ